MMNFETILRMTQKKLFKAIKREYGALHEKGAWLLIPGEASVLLVAHLDTVHKQPVKDICKTADGNIWMSPQGIGGDDRCGVYALLSVYERARIKPWLLFTCDEEIGGVGASYFCEAFEWNELPKELDGIKCIIEIDRKGKDDAVYYECANRDFEDYITSKGFTTQYGSYSDICDVAPVLGVAAVNLSSGYYNAHTQHEYINIAELNATIERVESIVEDSCKESFPRYEYIENKRDYFWDAWEAYRPGKVSDRYTQMYDELLEIYSPEELEGLVRACGEDVVKDLYEMDIMGVVNDDDKAI